MKKFIVITIISLAVAGIGMLFLYGFGKLLEFIFELYAKYPTQTIIGAFGIVFFVITFGTAYSATHTKWGKD